MKTILKPDFPSKMNALILKEFGRNPVLEETDVPLPEKGEILVKIHSSPVNPSDWAFLNGLYSSQKILPVIPGSEASGLVIATGDDLFSRRLLGKNVACIAPFDGHGAWAEYMLTKSKMAVPLSKEFDLEQGSMFFVNPLSALAMVEIAENEGHAGIANTAAASALGQMMIKMCQKRNIVLVNIVRREEQVELLKGIGAKYIVNSSSEDFTNELPELFKKLKVTLAFDAISGEMTNDLMEAMPDGGEVKIYGGLAGQPLSVDPRKFIFQMKRISGFWLSEWINRQNVFKVISAYKKVKKFIRDEHQTIIHDRVSLDEAVEGISVYLKKMTSGKILIQPWKERID